MNAAIDALNAFGTWLAGTLWTISLELAVLAAVVGAVLAALRVRSPRVRHGFWCLVLAKPLAVLLVASSVTMFSLLGALPMSEPPIDTRVQAGEGTSPSGPRRPGRLTAWGESSFAPQAVSGPGRLARGGPAGAPGPGRGGLRPAGRRGRVLIGGRRLGRRAGRRVRLRTPRRSADHRPELL